MVDAGLRSSCATLERKQLVKSKSSRGAAMTSVCPKHNLSRNSRDRLPIGGTNTVAQEYTREADLQMLRASIAFGTRCR